MGIIMEEKAYIQLTKTEIKLLTTILETNTKAIGVYG
jgi:hypothetical protein